MIAERSKLMAVLLTEQVTDLCFYPERIVSLSYVSRGKFLESHFHEGAKDKSTIKLYTHTHTQISMHVDVPGH